jgi:hypothetical protein
MPLSFPNQGAASEFDAGLDRFEAQELGRVEHDAVLFDNAAYHPADTSGTGAGTSTFWRGDGTWASPTSVPGDLNTQVQYNNAGAFGGITNVITDGAYLSLSTAIAPPTPASGITIYVDQFSNNVLSSKDDTGRTTITVMPGYALAHQFLLGFSNNGTPDFAQPDFIDLTGNIAITQMNGGTGATSATYWCGDGTWKAAPPDVVTTVFGRIGDVVATINDYDFNQLAGNIAVAQMNGGTDASATTYWQGDGTWATPATFTDVAPGYTPASGGGTANFLRADGTWTNPLASSAVTSVFGRVGDVVAEPNDYDFTLLSGNIAVSQMASGAGANTSTFWRGDGAWVIPNNFTTAASGYAPASGGGTTNFLRADGIWAAPPGSTGAVFTVFGRSGTVVAEAGDYDFALIAGNIDVIQMNNGTDASSTTFWCGDGTWAAPPTAIITSVFGRTGDILASPGDYNFTQISGNGVVDQLNSGIGATATTFWCGDGSWKDPFAAGGGSTPSDVPPLMDGVANPGVALPYSREDHVHPSDITKVNLAGDRTTGKLTVDDAIEVTSNPVAGFYFSDRTDPNQYWVWYANAGSAYLWGSATASNVNFLYDTTGVLKAGDTMTGNLTLFGPPTTDLMAATEWYVDQMASATSLWQGVYDPTTNIPDLTQVALQNNGWSWTVTADSGQIDT